MSEEPKCVYVVETIHDDVEVAESNDCSYTINFDGLLGCFSSKEKAVDYLKHIKDNNLIRLFHNRFAKDGKIIAIRKVELDSYDYDYDFSFDAFIKIASMGLEIEVINE